MSIRPAQRTEFITLSNIVRHEATNSSLGFCVYVCVFIILAAESTLFLALSHFLLFPSLSIQCKTMSSCSHVGLKVSLLLACNAFI